MGNNTTKVADAESTINATTKVLNQVNNTTKSTTINKTVVSSTATFNVTIEGAVVKGSVNVGQRTAVRVDLVSQMDAAFSTALKANLQQQLQASATDEKKGGLAAVDPFRILSKDIQDSNTEARENILNQMKDVINNSVDQFTSNYNSSRQAGVFNITIAKGSVVDGNVNVVQSNAVTFIASTLVTAFEKNIAANKTLTKAFTQSTSSNTGLSGDLFSSGKSIIVAAVIGLVVLGIVGVIGGGIFAATRKKKPAGGDSTTPASGTSSTASKVGAALGTAAKSAVSSASKTTSTSTTAKK